MQQSPVLYMTLHGKSSGPHGGYQRCSGGSNLARCLNLANDTSNKKDLEANLYEGRSAPCEIRIWSGQMYLLISLIYLIIWFGENGGNASCT